MVGQAGLGDLERCLDPLLLVGSGIDPSGARMKTLRVAGAPVSPCQTIWGWVFGNPLFLCMSTFYVLW